jgi:hypothetical protein
MSSSEAGRARGPKHNRFFSLLVLLAMAAADVTVYGQTDNPVSPWTAGADLYSSFVWRGTRQSGPAVQPEIEFSSGFFTAGAWGSFDFNDYQEVDLYMSFALNEVISVGIQDYYLPTLSYFDYSAASGSHTFEINLDYSSEHVWLSGNCVINEAGEIGSYGGDLYFEAGFSFDYFSLFMGAGNGWHTESGGFNACNLGLEVSEEIEITDRFSVPVTGQLIFNPDREQLFLVVGFAF